MNDLSVLPDLLATPDRYAWHPATETAILTDLHLGALGGMGGLGDSRTAAAWGRLVRREPQRVILAGDVMEDPAVGAEVVAACREMLELLPAGCRVTVTPGNHDPEDLGEKLGVEAVEAVRVGAYVVSHGDALPALLAETPGARWIIGHQHPAVTLRTRVQSAKMACYAVCDGASGRPAIILLPAFSQDAGGPLGTNLLASGSWLVPVPRPAPQKMHIYGLVEPAAGAAQVLDFGRLSALGELGAEP